MTQPTLPDPTPTDPPTPPLAGDPPADKATDALGDAGKKALAEERTARKAAEAELAKYRKAEQEKADADKTELQKAADRAVAAEEKATAAELKALRLEVASAKGLTAGQAKRLVGANREELEADAEDILANFPVKPAEPDKKTPAPDPSQGSKGDPKSRSTSLTAAVSKAISAKG
jgi:hypothetical protein